MTTSGSSEQAELLPGMARASVRKGPAAKKNEPVAEVDPVAQVLLELPLAHLDRLFDYAVPASMAEKAVVGARVKVRFGGQDVDGFVVARQAASAHDGVLQPLRRAVSAEPVLSPVVAELAGLVAERYAGTRADVLRLAVPPRHATTEREVSSPAPELPTPGPSLWAGQPNGSDYLTALAQGRAPKAVWNAPPAAAWIDYLAEAAEVALRAGQGSVLCVPDARDAHRLGAAIERRVGPDQHVVLVAESGPAARYRDFLAVSRGTRRIVVGNRAAAFAPVHDLGLVAIWDDGDELHAEPRAPYPHAREVLLLRARAEQTAVLVAGFTRTVESEYLVRTGWAQPLVPDRAQLRELVQVAVAGATDTARARDPFAASARIPAEAFALIRSAVQNGPVLVHTPRTGYAATLACERCRTPARCGHCEGPLRQPGPAEPLACAWCGQQYPSWACGACGHRGLRSPVVGDARTAEELGRAFPGVRVRSSSGDRVLDRVAAQPAIVVATPGAEPPADGGYAAVLLLDTWLAVSRLDLRAPEEALRRFLNAAGLVAPGGKVLAMGDPAEPVLQALVRWDPAGFAERELAERQSAHLTPASRMATLTGSVGALSDVMVLLDLPPHADVLGPVPVPGSDDERLVLRVPRADGAGLSRALGEMQRLRSARKLDPVRVQVDPVQL
ncbi:primosomal protein N' [Nocardioides sp. Bht2]|uniref:primosomal protein N' n=1 Tax=Nocardioides sp. Bht2 TaxID=3392297 RepID=UPI0039B67EB8